MNVPTPPAPRERAAAEADARDVLGSLTRLEREIVELRYTQRLDATERVREALRRLADAGPPAAVLERTAAELGGATSFDRVAVSRVRDGALVPLGLWTADAAMAPATLPAAALEPGSAEAEVARTRR